MNDQNYPKSRLYCTALHNKNTYSILTNFEGWYVLGKRFMKSDETDARPNMITEHAHVSLFNSQFFFNSIKFELKFVVLPKYLTAIW